MASVEKRGDSYRIISSCGYDTAGRKLRKSMTWTPAPGMTPKQIEKELQRQAVLFDERVRSGLYLDANTKFKEFSDKWITDYSVKQHKAKNVASNREALKRINAALGHIKLSKLQPHHILEYLHQLEEPGQNKKTGGSLSPKTISNHLRIISSILSTAVQWQIIPANPARSVKAPKVAPPDVKCLDDEQTVRLLGALEDAPIKYRVAAYVLIFTGARRGEVLGLKWDDIDFENCTMDINKAALYLPDRGIYEDTPKNDSSNRVVKLPQSVVLLLRKYRSVQLEERLKCADLWVGEGHVFAQWNGKPMHPDTLTQWFSGFVKSYNAGIERDEKIPTSQKAKLLLPAVSIHSLRHTNASLLIMNGANIRTVAARLGHAQTSTTVNIYSHAIKTADAIAADSLEAALLKTHG